MSAGITQLIAVGAQDEFIMGTPEISFFSSVFKRHSNFSQSIEKQTIHGSVKSNSMSSVQFERTGDLLSYVYLTMDDNTQALDSQRWDNIIEKVELLIGGSVIDTQDSVFTENIAVDTFAQNVSRSAQGTHPGISARSFFYPLRFFFCETPQSADWKGLPWVNISQAQAGLHNKANELINPTPQTSVRKVGLSFK